MATLPSLTERLNQARIALHSLMTGTSVVRLVDQNGETVEYKATNTRTLMAYIAQLEAEIAGTQTSGPLKTWLK